MPVNVTLAQPKIKNEIGMIKGTIFTVEGFCKHTNRKSYEYIRRRCRWAIKKANKKIFPLVGFLSLTDAKIDWRVIKLGGRFFIYNGADTSIAPLLLIDTKQNQTYKKCPSCGLDQGINFLFGKYSCNYCGYQWEIKYDKETGKRKVRNENQ